jgi:hypothetical protein
MRRPTRSEVAVGLLVAVPPGIGLAGFASAYTGEVVSVTTVAVGALATVALFAFLMAGVTFGEPDESDFGLPEDADDHNG